MTNTFRLLPVLLLSLLPVVSHADLYTASFEDSDTGLFTQLEERGVTWVAGGKSEITAKYAHTGKQSLHIFGGTDNTVELRLNGPLQKSRGMTFQAERWTSRSPFAFRVLAESGGVWREVSNLDALVAVGARFLSDIVVKLPGDKGVTGVRLVCTAPESAGILIDDVALLETEPKNVTKAPEVATESIARKFDDQALFVSGTQDTHTFRIPAIITAKNGDLIAVCDARRKSRADLIWVRDIDIAIRRSSDNGKTWTDMELICDFGDGRPASDPSLILDRETGEIFCFYNYMDQDKAPKEFRLYVQSSKDHGKTWGEATDITDQIAKPEWKMDFKFITSGRGVQARNGDLLHTMVNLKNGLHIFRSQDHGKSWHLLEVPITPGNESKVIELADGRLMVNCRVNGKGCRWVHVSEDRGKTWAGRAERNLVDPGCNGCILRYTSKQDGYAKNRLIFSNANSFKGRQNLSARISYDEGETWSDGKVIDPGPSAYSDLTICKDGSIGVLYEPGYKEVRFARFTLEDLTDGKDRLSKPYRLQGLDR